MHSCGCLAGWCGERNFDISLARLEALDELHCHFASFASARAAKNNVQMLGFIACQCSSDRTLFGVRTVEIYASAVNN